jgi:hypothetical protein
MITNFFMFILITLLAFFMVPKLYKSIIVDFFNTPTNATDNSVHTNIFHADWAIIIIFLVNLGVAFTSFSIYYIMFISSIAIAGYALIQFSKTQSAFMTTANTDASYGSDAKSIPDGANIFRGFSVIVTMFLALGNNGNNSEYKLFIPYLLFAALSFFIILSINYAVDYQGAVDDKKAEVKYFNGITWIRPLVLSLSVISPIIVLVINS